MTETAQVHEQAAVCSSCQGRGVVYDPQVAVGRHGTLKLCSCLQELCRCGGSLHINTGTTNREGSIVRVRPGAGSSRDWDDCSRQRTCRAVSAGSFGRISPRRLQGEARPCELHGR